MYFHAQEAIKAIILLMFSGFIFMLHHTGEIIKFINLEYTGFSQVASVIFLILFFIQVPRIFISREQAEDHNYCMILGCNHEMDKARKVPLKSVVVYAIIILPLVTGMFLPYKDLGAAEAVKRGICYTPNEQDLSHSDELVKPNKDLQEMLESPDLILDHVNFSTYVSNILTYPEFLKGKSIELEGFILAADSNSHDHPILGRLLVTHCVADAHVIGLLLSSDDNRLGNVNDWVKVNGEINIMEDDGQSLPVIEVKEWKETNQPEAPYIYP
ncbi:TIGR03943 family putative permease subunit [Texcoconibacillus texcoconensis]|uniref:Putative membrane protein n=1 Tax=Texcoconibacillus texcoconensis TaxID=1095777 RepID=A0A840QMJ3_9BACI|nr:TIGR03943 family protein [Texcoconibacillus texcoconensis]MBB5172602.1 putative membrane protein [Texcoconibacillus texcoconensis]